MPLPLLLQSVIRHLGIARVVSSSAIHVSRAGMLDKSRRGRRICLSACVNNYIELDDGSELRIVGNGAAYFGPKRQPRAAFRWDVGRDGREVDAGYGEISIQSAQMRWPCIRADQLLAKIDGLRQPEV